MARFFNTAGPCVQGKHYMIPASARLPEVPRLIAREGYFVIHAPRQTGKTTAIQALATELAAGGEYAAVRFSCEEAEPLGEDFDEAARAILRAIRGAAEDTLPAEFPAASVAGGLGRWSTGRGAQGVGAVVPPAAGALL